MTTPCVITNTHTHPVGEVTERAGSPGPPPNAMQCFPIGVLAPAHLGLQRGLEPRTLYCSAQSPTYWAASVCLMTTIWNSYTTTLRPVVCTIVGQRDYNSNNVTVASAPWTAVHVKQNYNAHQTCLLLFTSSIGTHTAASFWWNEKGFSKRKK